MRAFVLVQGLSAMGIILAATMAIRPSALLSVSLPAFDKTWFNGPASHRIQGGVVTSTFDVARPSGGGPRHAGSGLPGRSPGQRYLWVLLFVLLGVLSMVAQVVPPADDKKADEEINQLKREKEKVELEQAIATAKAERLAAGLPKTDTKPLEGKITAEDFTLPGSVLAFASASEVANQLSKDLRAQESNLETIVTYSEKDFASIAAYHFTLNQVDTIQMGYNRILGEPAKAQALLAPFLAPEFATTVLKSVADLLGIFRTETEIKGYNVTVDELSVVAELARALREANAPVKVIYTPTFLPAHFLKNPLEWDSGLTKKVNTLYKTRQNSSKAIADFDAKTDEQKKLDPLKDNIPSLKALNDQADKLISYLNSIDDKTGLNPFTLLLKAEALGKVVSKPSSVVLLTKVEVGAGSNKTTRNLFTGSKLYHNGGVVIAVLVFDADGSIKFSKVYYCVSTYTKFEKDGDWRFLNNF